MKERLCSQHSPACWIDLSNVKEDDPGIQAFFFCCKIPEAKKPGNYIFVEVPQGVVKFQMKEENKPGDMVEVVGDLHLLKVE